MWDRLYSPTSQGQLPWALAEPYPPMVRLVDDGWLTPPGPVLDVGCGLGTNAIWLASRGFRVTGVDVADGAIASAIAARPPGAENPNFVAVDVLANRLPPGKFRAAVDVGCFQTLPPRLRAAYPKSLARLLAPGAPLIVFWVGREEQGPWGPPHRLSVTDVVWPFESLFLVDRVEHRPRPARLNDRVRHSMRPLTALSGYSARFVRRKVPQSRHRTPGQLG